MSKAANIGCFIVIIFLIFVIIGITKIDSSESSQDDIVSSYSVDLTGTLSVYDANGTTLTESQKESYISALTDALASNGYGEDVISQPDLGSCEFVVASYGMNIGYTAVGTDGSNKFVNAWIEKTDSGYQIHYLDIKGDTVIDDGKIQE